MTRSRQTWTLIRRFRSAFIYLLFALSSISRSKEVETGPLSREFPRNSYNRSCISRDFFISIRYTYIYTDVQRYPRCTLVTILLPLVEMSQHFEIFKKEKKKSLRFYYYYPLHFLNIQTQNTLCAFKLDIFKSNF